MRHPQRVRGLTSIELLAILVALVVLAAFMVFLTSHQDRPARRTVCAANLKAFAQAVIIYGEANDGIWPSVWRPSEASEGISGNRVGDRRELQDGLADETATSPNAPNESNTRGYYKLLLGGRKAYLQPKQLVCPSAVKSLGHDRNGTVPMPVIDGRERSMYDFDGTKVSRDGVEMTEFSYSFLVLPAPQTTATQQTETHSTRIGRLDPRMALAADRNPYSNCVVVSPNGYGEYQFNPLAQTKPPPPADQAAFDAACKVRDRGLNSRNHAGEGQNAGFVDGHAKWFSHSWVGADGDCIWTTSELMTDAGGTIRVIDRVPASGADYGRTRPNPLVHTDSLLAP